MDYAESRADPNAGGEHLLLLGLRLVTLVTLVVLLTLHIRSLRVFRWEQSVSGGIIVTYVIASLGLTLCAGRPKCGGAVFQAYLCSVGGVLFSLNAFMMWRRWRHAGDMTRVVAELLVTLGVPLRRQVLTKVILSIAIAVSLFLDLAVALLLPP